MLYAEKKSSKKYTGRFSWSPDLIKSVQAERYWKLWLKTTKGIHVSPQALRRTQEAAGLTPISPPPTLQTIVQELSKAKQTRKALQKKHPEPRENYLTRLSTSLVLKASPRLEDPKYEQQLQHRIKEATKRLIKKERRRAMYRSIGRCLTPNTNNYGGISRVDVPHVVGDKEVMVDPKTWKGPWRAITEPSEIGFYVSQANIKQYNQAEQTPFGSGYLAKTLGDVLTSTAAEDLLQGNLEVDSTKIPFPETQVIVEFLGTPYQTPITNNKCTISPAEFKLNYTMVQEKTSSSYLGRHVGHYKAILKNDYIVNIHASMMSIPYQIGFAPSQWHQVINVMLEKDPGQPKQYRLRIVALLESDYNQSQRILLARPLSHHLEDNKMMPAMQYGSRPSKMCISPVLNKVMTYDLV
jgi:hypothetical protein